MARIETLGILQGIESLVSDQLQVLCGSGDCIQTKLASFKDVSYKWLSRNYSVSSNVAKRLLEEFVEKHANRLEVVYTLSGWLKCDPSSYHIRLVSGPKVTEAKQDFEDSCSVQVHSVQASIPKDLASLWNAEYVQAEEFFKQPSIADNCLRDNRFCAISNSFVKRNVEETSASSAPHLKSLGQGTSKSDLPCQNITTPPQLQNKGQHSSSNIGSLCRNVEDLKSERNGIGHEQASRASADKENVPSKPANKKKVQNDKGSPGTGGSWANLWDCASAKTKPVSLAENRIGVEAQIDAREAVEGVSSDDGGQNLNFMRASNGEGTRKRRMVFDFSDDQFEVAVNLGSPDIPTKKSSRDLNEDIKVLTSQNSNLNFDTLEEQKPKVKEGLSNDRGSNHQEKEDTSVVSNGGTAGLPPIEKTHSCPENDVNKNNKQTKAVPGSPKRRKVMKTRMDGCGREVTEVVWEGEETAPRKIENGTIKKADNSAVISTVNRPPAMKKLPAVGNNTAPSNTAAKGGKKKRGNKDPKQGNILSFFKRV